MTTDQAEIIDELYCLETQRREAAIRRDTLKLLLIDDLIADLLVWLRLRVVAA